MTSTSKIRSRIDSRLAREAKLVGAWLAPTVTAIVGLVASTSRLGSDRGAVLPLWLTLATFALAWLTVWTSRDHVRVRPVTVICWTVCCATAVATVVLAFAIPVG